MLCSVSTAAAPRCRSFAFAQLPPPQSFPLRQIVQYFAPGFGGQVGGTSRRNRPLTLILFLLWTNSALHGACADVTVTATVIALNFQTNFVQLPPQFTNVTTVYNTNVGELCTTSLNVTDSTSVYGTTALGQYNNLHDYNVLRANRSIFPTFGNELIITPTDAVATSYVGGSIALSADGSVLAVGPYFLARLHAVVRLYRRSGTTWVFQQELASPIPTTATVSAGVTFGASLALSYDGSILAVGQPTTSAPSPILPYVFMYVYESSSNAWVLVQTLLGGGGTFSGFADNVDLSATGQYLVVDSYSPIGSGISSQCIPVTRVYERQNSCTALGAWQLVAQVSPMANGHYLEGGTSGDDILQYKHIAISADGTTLIMSWIDLTPQGHAAIFKRQGSVWQQVQLMAFATPVNAYSSAVALSATGSYAALGYPDNSIGGNNGRVYIFAQRGTTYEQEAVLTSNTAQFGSSVSLSADGTTLIVGSGSLGNSGPTSGLAVFLRASNDTWSQQAAFSAPATDSFGFSCACSADGAFIAAGAPLEGVGQIGYFAIFRPIGSFIPNDTVVSGSLCVYHKTTIDSTLNVAGNIHVQNTIVTGTAGHVTACVAPLALSDKRLKDDIEPLSSEQALEIIRALKPASFEWNSTNKRDTGFVAQELEQIAPHWVKVQTTPEGEVKMIYLHQELYAYILKALETLAEKTQKNRETLGKLLACHTEPHTL